MAQDSYLLKGGTVLTLAAPGDCKPDCDVLVTDGKIASIGRDIDASGVETIDVSGRIVMPGFIDTHRHTWQAAVRNIASDWSLLEYMAGLHTGLSSHYRPEDTYIGNYLGALEALDSGITTLLDWSHNLFTPEHADAAIQALRDTGIRAVFAHGGGAQQWGGEFPSPIDHPEDVRRIRAEQLPSDHGLVTMALALRGPQFTTAEINKRDFELARELDLRVSVHVGDGAFGKTKPIHQLQKDGLLWDTTTYIHCNTLPDDELQMIADSGGTASVAPDVEAQMGHGYPATGRLIATGLKPSLSIDTCSSNGGDMFGTMRTAIGMQRASNNSADVEAGVQVQRLELTCDDIVQMATINGARATGLDHVTGSLEIGKAADILVLQGDSLAMTPMNNPFGSLVYAAHPGVVRDVFVDGVRRKRDGKLVDVDFVALKSRAEASRDHVVSAVPGASADGSWHPGI